MTEREHTVADVLFRHLHTVSDNIDKKFEEDINDFLKTELNVMKVALI